MKPTSFPIRPINYQKEIEERRGVFWKEEVWGRSQTRKEGPHHMLVGGGIKKIGTRGAKIRDGQ